MELNETWESERKLIVEKDTNSSNPISTTTTDMDSDSVKSVPKEEILQKKEKQGETNSDENDAQSFVGDWITEGSFRAKVAGKLCGYWFGWLRVETLNVPTFWDTRGNSSNPAFSLLVKRRSAEFWDD